jgi:hypothetical protein
MVEQFIPLYVALFCGSMAAAMGAVFMSFRLHAQTVRTRRSPDPVRGRTRPF